jgi:methylaspartate ammonia-lyase
MARGEVGKSPVLTIMMSIPEAQALISAAQALDQEGYDTDELENYVNWVASRINTEIQQSVEAGTKAMTVQMMLPEAQALITAAHALDREGYESDQQESYLDWVATRIEKGIRDVTGGSASNPSEDEDDSEGNPSRRLGEGGFDPDDEDEDEDDDDDDEGSGYRYV